MAELGIAASILSIAAIGTSLATTLYEKAEILRHARSEIASMAKHVSRFTAVLKHMSQVLDAEKESCSKEMARDIRRISRSCTKTFKEINSTVKSQRSAFVQRFRWMVKRAKARELETRLESLQSMLQCMIHTLTVSKLGQMDSRSRNDSDHVSNLSTEIKLLKTLIIENHSNLEELRRAEQDNESQNTDIRERDANVMFVVSTHQPGRLSPLNRSPALRNRSPASSPPQSDSELSVSSIKLEHIGQGRENPEDKMRPHPTDKGSPRTDGNPPPPPYNGHSKSNVHRQSDLLLQMVPYKAPDPFRPCFLLTGGPVPNKDVISGMREATSSVRLLLDKWTNLGSAPVSDILAKEAVKDAEREEEIRLEQRANSRQVPYEREMPPDASTYNDFDQNYKPPPHIYRPHDEWTRPGHGGQSAHIRQAPMLMPPHTDIDVWRFPHAHFDQEILWRLRQAGAGLVYTKRSKCQQVHYIDYHPVLTINLVPTHLITPDDKPLFTELGQGLIRKEALDLLDYSYEQTTSGHFSIAGDLYLTDIDDLVRLSYQALNRALREQSKQLMTERDPNNLHRAYSPLPYVERRPPHPGTGYRRRGFDHSRTYDNIVVDRSDAEEYEEHVVQPDFARSKAEQPFKPSKIPDRKPRPKNAKKSQPQNHRRTKSPIMLTPSSAELDKAIERLEFLRKKQAESEQAKDLQRVTDLKNFAIPEQEEVVSRLKKQLEATARENDLHSRRVEVETETESDEGSDPDDRFAFY